MAFNQNGGYYQRGVAYDLHTAHLIVDRWLELGNHDLNQSPVPLSYEQLAQQLSVSRGYVAEHVRRFLQDGFIGTYERGGDRRSKLDWDHCIYLYMLVKIFPDAYIHEHNNRLLLDTGLMVSHATVSRTLAYLKLSRKMKVVVAEEKFNPENMQRYVDFCHWRDNLDANEARRVVILDEMGVRSNNAVRKYMREVMGMRGVDIDKYVPDIKWNFIAAMTADGVLPTCFGFPNNEDLGNGFGHEVFEWWFCMVLLPAIAERVPEGAIIVMDNARFHRRVVLEAMAGAIGATVKFLPAYSPELSPCELLFGYTKMEAGRNWQRVRGDLYESIIDIMLECPDAHCARWFRHCGYPVQ